MDINFDRYNVEYICPEENTVLFVILVNKQQYKIVKMQYLFC